MKPIEIRIELLRKGYSNIKVAKELGVSPTTIHNVIYDYGRSRRVAKRIAKITGLSVSTLWPGCYLPKSKAGAARCG